MQPQRTGDDLPPSLCGLGLRGEAQIVSPQGEGARVPKYGALVDVEDAGVGGERGRVFDLFSGAALGTQTVQVELPGDVGLEVVWLAAGAEDEVFVFGALGDEAADFFLYKGQR